MKQDPRAVVVVVDVASFFAYRFAPCSTSMVCCWSRSLLADIVKIKMEHYEMSKVRSQSAEEYLKAFFEAELKPIWPQGWIQTRYDAYSFHRKLCILK